jgi:ATP/maltotriose-dependent transcriptional regulator MalT
MQIAAELAIGLGDEAWIERFTTALLPHRALLGITASGTLCYGLVATTLGWLALARGDHEEAIELLEEAVERALAMGAPFESVKARRLLATALVAVGRGDEAAPTIAAATSDARRHGFDGEVRRLATLAG